MTMAQWEPYDAYPTKEGAMNAARDLRASLKSYAPDTQVAVHQDKNAGRLKWVVMVKGRH